MGDKEYPLQLSRLAYGFNGAISLEYLENVSYRRVMELNNHAKAIAEEVKSGGK